METKPILTDEEINGIKERVRTNIYPISTIDEVILNTIQLSAEAGYEKGYEDRKQQQVVDIEELQEEARKAERKRVNLLWIKKVCDSWRDYKIISEKLLEGDEK